MMKRPANPKMPAKVDSGMRKQAKPTVYMANGGSVKKMAGMAGNAKSGTCGPGVSSRSK